MSHWGTRNSFLQLILAIGLALPAACNSGPIGGEDGDLSGARSEACTPDCGGKECGDDGCGGSCGNCIGGELCNGLGTCYDPNQCTPDCAGKACGGDGCGASCGSCAGGELCDAVGTCYDPNQCTPDCAGKECGGDGCGASCGTCTAPTTCGGTGIPNRCGDGTATAGLFLDGFFPIGSFMIYPPQAAMHVARGINTAFVVPDMSGEYTDQQWDTAMVAAGLKVVRRPIGDLVTDAAKPHVLAWAHPDEPDIPPIPEATFVSIENDYAAWKAAVPDKPVYINFGGSDILEPSPYDCNGPGDQGGPYASCYPRFIAAADWIVNDIYPIDGWLSNEAWRYDITKVGDVLDKLRGYPPWSIQWTDKPLMGFVEASFFDSSTGGVRAATGPEVRAMIWNLIIHEARGIIYFPLVVNPSFMWDNMPADVEAEIKIQHVTLTQLANVLQGEINPQSISARVSAPLEAGWRNSPNGKYFFVLNTSSSPVNGATIELTGAGAANLATVYGESRTVSLTNGSTTDDFGPYAIHIYVVN